MRLLALLAALSLTCHLHAQSTLADLRTRLVKQPLYLRGKWREDKLRFDASGQLLGASELTTFTIAGIDIHSVELKSDRLVLKGKRAGLEFQKDQPKRVVVDAEALQIEIAAPASGDYTLALDHILTASLPDLLQPVPSYWRPFAQQHLLPPQALSAVTTTEKSPSPSPGAEVTPEIEGSSAQPFRVGSGMEAPRLLAQIEPRYSAQAKALQYSASVLVQLEIDANGNPAHLILIRPAGLELDERALAAVSHYKFAPATRNGQPVPVLVNVDVNFQLL